MMGRRPLFVLVILVTWFGSLVVKPSVGTPLAVVAPLAHFDVERPTHVDKENFSLARKPEITKLKIRGAVTSRFSSTTVTSILKNHADEAAEAVFLIQIPKEAFIANFSMEIDGIVYPAEIKDKETAQRIYNEARYRGQSAGQVKQQSEEKVNHFSVSVTVAKKNFVTFELIYQEMLTREHGYFEHRTSIRPGQIVKSIKMQVAIIETQGLMEVNTSWVKEQPDGNKITKHGIGDLRLKGGNKRAFIEYAPTVEEQRQESEDGIQGDFVIRYDVDHPKNGGELQIVNGYFVHYFSPEGLPVVRKNVVFVIDVSGSMTGRKIQQTKEAMSTILDDLREIDYFNIVTFTDDTSQWRSTLQQGTPENIRHAKNFVSSLSALYGTNLHAGLRDGVRLLKRLTEDADDSIHGVSMVIMLTDGLPTSGETVLDVIESDVEREIDGKLSLFNLGFGDNVNYKFLEKLALRNGGLARKIYDDSQASLQLEGFFDEVATPLLYNVIFNYPEEVVEINSLTQTIFPYYFQGTELVVTGKMAPGIGNVIPHMTIAANSVDVPIEFPLTIDTENPPKALLNKHIVDDFAERLWAYLSIKELLRRRSISNNGTEKDALKKQALKLSLEYHFVTPLTSLVVVKPDEDKPEYVGSNPVISKQEGQHQKGPATSSYVTASRPVPKQGPAISSYVTSSRPVPKQGNVFRQISRHVPKQVRKTKKSSAPVQKKSSAPVQKIGRGFTGGRRRSGHGLNWYNTYSRPVPKQGPAIKSHKTSPRPVPKQVPTVRSYNMTSPRPIPRQDSDFKSLPDRHSFNQGLGLTGGRRYGGHHSPFRSGGYPSYGYGHGLNRYNTYSRPVPKQGPAIKSYKMSPRPVPKQVPTVRSYMTSPRPIPRQGLGLTGGRRSGGHHSPFRSGGYPSYGYGGHHSPFRSGLGHTRGRRSGRYHSLFRSGPAIKSYKTSSRPVSKQGTTVRSYMTSPRPIPKQGPTISSYVTSSRPVPNQAEGDLHFIVNVPHSDLYVCFNIVGLSGDNYRLIHDPETDLTVTGKTIEEPFLRPGSLRKRSYFGEVTFEIGKKTIVLSPSQITFDKSRTITWQHDDVISYPDFSISIEDERFARIDIGTNITFVTTRHVVTSNNAKKVWYMDVYIEDGQGLSDKVNGLIGQFQDTNMSIDSQSIRVNSQFEVGATLNVKSRQVSVTKQYRMVLALAQDEPCWFAGDNAAGLIDGSHVDYLERRTYPAA